MLLLGVFMCVTLAGLQTATPSTATCAVGRLGVGLAYAIVFSALLVKSVFLISLNGGVYLPAPYQALLLLFAVLIQVTMMAAPVKVPVRILFRLTLLLKQLPRRQDRKKIEFEFLINSTGGSRCSVVTELTTKSEDGRCFYPHHPKVHPWSQ